MNKKIIAIAIIGMFLLTGLTVLSAGGKEAALSGRSSTETGELIVFVVGGIFIPRGITGVTVTATAKDGSGRSYEGASSY